MRFDMVCDRTVASTNGPDVGIAVPGACEYAVRWRTPLACPVTEPDPTACAAAPLPAAPVPTARQAAWQQHEIMALVHFNMATFAHDGDPGCAADNWATAAPYAAGETRHASTFNPEQLNTTQWVESMLNVAAIH